MIENRKIANEISKLALDVSKRLNLSIFTVQEQCSDAEFMRYRRAVGAVMAELLLEILNPLYQKHPDLKPPELN